MFVESAHGDGDTQATGEAREFVDSPYGTGLGSGASFLPEAERIPFQNFEPFESAKVSLLRSKAVSRGSRGGGTVASERQGD